MPDLEIAIRSALLGLLLLALHRLYQHRLLPQPIPDIPHNASAAQKLLGDLPTLQKEMARTQNIQSWLLQQTLNLKSPLIQVFLEPFSKPILVLSDPRESLDVLLYRSRDFDRGPMLYDIFSGLSPTHHIGMKTGPEWKRHRNLVQHLVTTPFLHETVAPAIHASVLRLVQLWSIKCGLAKGSAFAAQRDIQYMILDALLEVSFGKDFPNNGISSQVDLIQDQPRMSPHPDHRDQVVSFAEAAPHEFIRAHKVLSEAIEDNGASLFPRTTWWVMSKLPRLARALRIQRRVTRAGLRNAAQTVTQHAGTGVSRAWSSAEFMAHHERGLAAQERRQPDYLSPAMEDELYGTIFAGSHTSYLSFQWAIKILADNPSSQRRLQLALRAGFPEAVREGRPPSVSELISRPIAYLYATIEEILRFSPATLLVDRIAIRDTELLGHAIPKGTCVWAIPAGAGFTSPTHPIPETQRSVSSRKSHLANDNRHEWVGGDIDRFRPERWLRPASPGSRGEKMIFDANAGPILAFGAGPRGCFGRPLAYLQMRMALALLVWHFEFRGCPGEVAGYDAVDGLFHKPKNCFVSLREAGGHSL